MLDFSNNFVNKNRHILQITLDNPAMQELKDRMKAALDDANLKNAELARIAKTSRTAVSDWLSGKSKSIRGDKLIVISRALNVDPDWLANGKGDRKQRHEVREVSPAYQATSFVPIISSVQAGGFSEAIDIYEPGYAEDSIARINGGEKVFALYVDGDSMTAPAGSTLSFPEGYIVHVDPEQCAVNGDCVIAKVEGKNEATFKQLKYDGETPYLRPLNPMHPPIFDEFKIIGKVIGASIKL